MLLNISEPPSQKAEAPAAAADILPTSIPEPLPAETLPPATAAVDITVNTVGALSPDEPSPPPPPPPHSQPSPSPSPSPEAAAAAAGSLRRPTPELAPQSVTPEPLLQPGLEPKMFQKDPYMVENPARSVKPGGYDPQQQAYHPDQQPYRDYDHPPSRYDGGGGGGGYLEPKYRAYDSHLPYENSVPHYDQQQWNPYSPPAAASPQGYDARLPYGDLPERQYSPPQPRYDEPPPQQQQPFDGRPRYGKPAGTTTAAPIRYDEPPPPGPGYDLRQRYDHDQAYPPAACSPDPASGQRPGAYSSQGPPPPQQQQHRGYNPTPINSEPSPTPPPKAEAPSPSPAEPAFTAAASPSPLLPPSQPAEEQPPPTEDDPAMQPRSVLNRVKMFEEKRSVSVDRVAGDASGIRAADLPVKPGGGMPKANSLSNLDQEKSFSRAPEPQKPQSKVAEDDVVRPNHYNPDEDEEYYRKQLSYLDRLQAGPTKPQAQSGYNYPRAESVEKISPVEKRYEPVPQVTPALPPAILPKPTSSEAKPPGREDTVQSNFLPHKSFPEKSPVNGTSDHLPKPSTGNGAAPANNYNRYVPKPYTSSARPFERKFDSPKFNHNLLPNDKPELAVKGPSPSPVKPQISPQPQSTDPDSGVDTFTRTMDHRSKYQHNNVNAVPKAIPVSPSALDDDDDDEGHTVVATARGIFNCNGGVLSSIETGVSIIIPQGAIPEGVEQEIYFKVCRDNSILPPLDKEKGETLLSPLVMCGPHGLKFLKPVELRLPHCDPKSWQNKSLPGDPNYLVGANCVSVLIDHF